MPEFTNILLARPTVVPPLDPEFRPVALGNRRYRQAIAGGKAKVPLAIALERNDGHVFVFKRFAFHHVAPMAGRVADAQENRLVLLARPGKGGRAPGIPVHRIVRVLEEVR